jgi:hypothetical protein
MDPWPTIVNLMLIGLCGWMAVQLNAQSRHIQELEQRLAQLEGGSKSDVESSDFPADAR